MVPVTLGAHEMAQCPYAWWKPISHNFNQGRMQSTILGLVIHITDGHGDLPIVRGDFDHVGAKKSSHFAISKNGDLWQFVDTDNRAWAIDGDTWDSQWISVENVAKLGEKLTNEQLMGCAMLLRWMHELYDVPFTRSVHAKDAGLGYHRMFHIGDHVCPGVPVKMQLEYIVRKAGYLWWKDSGDQSVPLYMREFTN